MLPVFPGCRGAAGHTVPPNSASSVAAGPTLAEGFCGHMQIHSVNKLLGLGSEKQQLLSLWIPHLDFCACQKYLTIFALTALCQDLSTSLNPKVSITSLWGWGLGVVPWSEIPDVNPCGA